MILHEKMAAQLPAWRERVKTLVKEHGETVIDQVTIGQVYGGMRDIKSMVTDVSFVDPATGIKFRGMAIPEVLARLPKPRVKSRPMYTSHSRIDGYHQKECGGG
jgi:citrate synthase